MAFNYQLVRPGMVFKVLKRGEIMENEKDTSRQLMFLEPVNADTDVDHLFERLVLKLESFGFNIIGKDEETKDES